MTTLHVKKIPVADGLTNKDCAPSNLTHMRAVKNNSFNCYYCGNKGHLERRCRFRLRNEKLHNILAWMSKEVIKPVSHLAGVKGSVCNQEKSYDESFLDYDFETKNAYNCKRRIVRLTTDSLNYSEKRKRHRRKKKRKVKFLYSLWRRPWTQSVCSRFHSYQ